MEKWSSPLAKSDASETRRASSARNGFPINHLPPGPKGSPFIGSLAERLRDPLGFFTNLISEFGTIAFFRLPFTKIYVVSDPELVRQVFQDSGQTYIKGKAYDGLRKFLGDGVFTANGPEWARQRKALMPLFQTRVLSRFVDVFERCLKERFARISKSGETEFDLHEEMILLTIEIISRSLFGSEADDDLKKQLSNLVAGLTHTTNEYTFQIFKWPSWIPTKLNRKIRDNQKQLNKIIFSILSDRMKSPASEKDLISIMMDTKDSEGRRLFSDEILRDQVVTLFLAGHETTASVLTWSIWHLALNPALQEKCRAEAIAGPMTIESLSSLQMTKAVILESLRLYPPVWVIPREVIQDTQIGKYSVAKKSFVVVCPYALHRLPTHWDEPNSYVPERHFAKDAANRYVFLPFSAGQRSCVGESFAMFEMLATLSAFVREFNFFPMRVGGQTLEPVLTLRPKGDFKVMLRARS